MTAALNFDEANSGLDLIANGALPSRPEDEIQILVHRLIERLLDQLKTQGRDATTSEDKHFRSAISAYRVGSWVTAISYAWRASRVGSTPITPGIFELDTSKTLRDELAEAKQQHNAS